MASRVALDSQGRLVLRENGKIILPYEHFANAVMLKHMNGPHGLHLGLEGTVRAVMESYTIGRECFGMEKEFIIEVVQNCPNPACRYYKNQLELTQKMGHMAPTYIQENEATASLLRTGFPHSTDFQAVSKFFITVSPTCRLLLRKLSVFNLTVYYIYLVFIFVEPKQRQSKYTLGRRICGFTGDERCWQPNESSTSSKPSVIKYSASACIAREESAIRQAALRISNT